MKNSTAWLSLTLFFPAGAWGQQLNRLQVTVDNQTTDSIYISRLGTPEQQLLIPKRIVRTVDVPLAPGAAESLQMLQVTLPDSIIVPETSFAGFSGKFAQAANLTISPPRNVRIQYNAGAGRETTTSAPSGASDGGTPVSSGGYAGTGYPGNSQGSGYNGPGNYPTAKTRQTNSANRKTAAPEPPSLTTTTKHGEKRRTTLPGATGVRVKITSPGLETLITPPEPPAPIQASKPVVALKQSASSVAAPARKSSLRSVIIWSSIATGLLGFVFWKRARSK